MNSDDGIFSANDFSTLNIPKRDTGAWVFRPENLTLYNQELEYEVDLEDMTSPAQALDWILEIGSKIKAYDFQGFLNALEDTVYSHFGNSIQGVFCPFGANMAVDWKHKTYKPNESKMLKT
jgi:hypothetical protein